MEEGAWNLEDQGDFPLWVLQTEVKASAAKTSFSIITISHHNNISQWLDTKIIETIRALSNMVVNINRITASLPLNSSVIVWEVAA